MAKEWYHGHLERQTIQNKYYRRVISTNDKQQLVLMYLQPGQEIGMEVHPKTSQFIRIESGTGVIEMDGHRYKVRDGYAVLIPPGTNHNVTADRNGHGLKLYTIYSPPEHPRNTKELVQQ